MAVDYSTDLAYANNRLGDSIVLHKGQPVYVVEVRGDEGGRAIIRSIPQNNTVGVPLSELDLTPVRLGYVNEDGDAHYAMRVPSRQWRQGLRSSQLISLPSGNWRGRNRITTSSNFANTVVGNYPSPISCYESIVNGEVNGQAFSRSFAIVRTNRRGPSYNLCYKATVVGTAHVGDSRMILTIAPKFSYLTELLEEERNGRP